MTCPEESAVVAQGQGCGFKFCFVGFSEGFDWLDLSSLEKGLDAGLVRPLISDLAFFQEFITSKSSMELP